MYLKSLEIQGFKSFPDKTVLTFGKDITAIVGPNGSGKSNISDAIRWVMGEQSSKSLRGGKMEDVIFGGTQMRRQTGYAQVSLLLDNSQGIFPLEESEVMVTRRYYRSGESEYYINRRSCRLRDVNELFMDTGLGREGYSIIGQGRIDEILSIKSQDRREIFEEAAGISRFRHRKEEAERHLSKTEENLLRINDKLAELELQVEPLRQQAEKAKKYLTLRDELRGLEVSLWMEQLDRLRASNIRLMTDYAAAVAQRDEVALVQENLYARAEELQQQLRGLEQRTEEVRLRQGQQDTARAEVDSRIAVLENRRQSNLDTARRLSLELSDQQGREDGLARQLARGEERLAEIAAATATLTGYVTTTEAEREELAQRQAQAQARTEALRRQEGEQADHVAALRAELSALSATSQELLDRQAGLRSGLEESAAQLDRARQAAQEHRSLCAAQQEKRLEAKNRIAAWQLKTQNRRRRVDELTERANRLQVEGNTLRSRIRMLTEMERDFEGYSKTVRQIMSEAGRGGLTHIRGPVAGLLRVPDAYTIAIEIALGGAMQNIVVDDEAAGKRAIGWLKRRDAGRATFLPLSVIRPNTLQERGLEEEFGYVGIASELIECEAVYRDLFRNLLGRVVIAEDMDAAIEIANRYRHRFRIVTLDGQVLNPGGSMTGGSVSKNAGILSRANELKRLRTQEERLQKETTTLQEQLREERRQLEKLSYQLETAQGELRAVEDEVLRLDTVARNDTQRIAEMEGRLHSLQQEITLLGSRSGQNEQQLATAQQQYAAQEGQLQQLQRQVEDSRAAESVLTEQSEILVEQLADLRLQQATLRAEAESTEGSLEQLRQLQQDLSGDRESRLQRLAQLEEEQQSLLTQLEQEGTRQRVLQQQREATGQQLALLNQEKLRIEAERTRADREAREKNDELLRMEREVAALEQKKNAASNEEDQLLDKLWENYELSHSAAQKVRFPLESVPKANRRISELKRSISALGAVNVGAIEDYDRVNGRYTYLIEQRDDIEKSKAELLRIIAELVKEMEAVFREAFARIQVSFSETFRELFGGGQASLELEDPKDILGCGIEIRVQPPGKALKVITLLSGGEKAFVAIALYFAILKVKPTPFVVMDEIEAALDDSNVVRFARYMRTITARTQFIVITHRRGTMEEADVLYGVTMQEQGVSRMLMVDLEQAISTVK